MTPADPNDTVMSFDPIAFLESAVKIPSHEDVSAMRIHLVETLEANGADASVDEAGNVLATRCGDRSADERTMRGSDDESADERTTRREEAGTHVVFNTHIDTVSPHVPFERDDEAGIVRGRGACDAKGPLAALLAAFFAVDLDGGGRVTLAVTPDEEALSTGAHALVSDPSSPIRTADAVIVGEPTGLDVCTASKGRFQGTITLTGTGAHAAQPDSGANAVAGLAAVFRALETFDDRADAPATHSDLGAPTLTPTLVDGGEASNRVPATSRLTIDRRSVPPETADTFEDRLRAQLAAAVPADLEWSFSFTDRPTPFLEAWETPSTDPLVETIARETDGQVRPFTAATEASYFAAHAPTVVFGPGVLVDEEGPVAHGAREYVSMAAVDRAAAVLERTIESLVG